MKKQISGSTIALPSIKAGSGRQGVKLASMGFPVGTEAFDFSTVNLGSISRMEAVETIFVDASAMVGGHTVLITTPTQSFSLDTSKYSRAYFNVASQVPFECTITSGGNTGTLKVNLYNYAINPFIW